jgi:ubiquinone biosynthesis protein
MALSIDPEHVKRYGQIAGLLVRHGRADLVKRAGLESVLEDAEPVDDGAGSADAESLARDLERLGPTFVKLGQLLASRVDLLPPAYTEALSRLQDDVEPFGFEEVERMVSDELGVRLSKAFQSFDPEPMAAGSLAQVHRAVLRSGQEVAVKVQRPGVRPQIREDLEALSELAGVLDEHSERAHRYRVADVLEQFRRTMLRELDFRTEARNLTRLGENLRSMDTIRVPRPVEDYTTSRVLTMERVHGTKVTALSPVAVLELDRERLADDLFRAYLRQILVDGFFHADPHPGNVFITEDQRIALLDVGQMATLAPADRDALTRLLLAVADGEADEAADLLVEIGEPEEDADVRGFRDQVGELVLQARGRTAGEIALGAVVLELVRLAGEHGIRPASSMTMLGKTLINLDEVGRTLDPDLDPNDAIRRHAAELMERQMLSSLSPSAIFRAMLDANELIQQMPGRLNRIMDLLSRNQLTLGIDAIDEVRVIQGLEKIANRITLGLIIAALIVGAAMLINVDAGPSILGYPALSLILFLAAALAGIVLAARIVIKDRD